MDYWDEQDDLEAFSDAELGCEDGGERGGARRSAEAPAAASGEPSHRSRKSGAETINCTQSVQFIFFSVSNCRMSFNCCNYNIFSFSLKFISLDYEVFFDDLRFSLDFSKGTLINMIALTLRCCSSELIPALIPDSTCQSVLEQDTEAQNRTSTAVM